MAELSDDTTLTDPAHRAAAVDLIAVIAYGELSAFERLVDDARLAPALADRLALEAMAVTQFACVKPLLDRLETLGAEPISALEPFEIAFDAFHAQTAPMDYLEGLVKAFVGDALAADFYREVATFLDEDTRTLIGDSLDRAGQTDFIVDRVRAAIVENPSVAGRLALWARRLMGEALAQAQRVAAERDALMMLLTGTPFRDGLGLAEIGEMFARMTELHKARMAALGLEP